MTMPAPTRDQNLVKNFLISGAAAGGGIGLMTSLVNYLTSLKEEADAAKAPDSDTIFLNLRRSKQKQPQDKEASMAAVEAITGGILSAGGAYALVHKLYDKMRLKQVKEQLEQAQQGYVDVLHDQADKEASEQATGKPLGWPEGALSLPPALGIILALSSAAVTNKMLEKTFPTKKPPGRRDPRRVVIRDEDDAEGTDKVAYLTEEDGEEFVCRLLLHTKSAGTNEWKDMIHAVGQGRHATVADGLINYDIQTTGALVKGASAEPLTEPARSMALAVALRSPTIGPSIRKLAAAEALEMSPVHWATVAALKGVEGGQEILDNLEKIACLMGAALRHDACAPYAEAFDLADKSASAGAALSVLDDVLLAMNAHNMVKNKANGPETPEDDDQSTDDDKKPKIVAHGDDAKRFEQKHKDVIDAALAN